MNKFHQIAFGYTQIAYAFLMAYCYFKALLQFQEYIQENMHLNTQSLHKNLPSLSPFFLLSPKCHYIFSKYFFPNLIYKYNNDQNLAR